MFHITIIDLIHAAEEESSQSSSEEPDLATHILRWILEITKAKIMELVEKFQSLVNEVLRSSEREGSTTETTDQLDEKIMSSTFLAIVILLIVVVARAQSAWFLLSTRVESTSVWDMEIYHKLVLITFELDLASTQSLYK